ncbi:MAG: RNase adapter RapZ [Gammaproteobacteria bacterium]|nr:RNase adapter RapZ [Gammaproteobacteria bacterium]
MRLIVVSGLSGAGKSIAMDALEDLGYYCIDNLPVKLLPALATDLEGATQPASERAAVAIDARTPAGTLGNLPTVIGELRERGVVHDLVFLEADESTLIKRFSETRRKHPLTARNVSLAEAIRRERSLLAPLRNIADICVDTSRLHLHQLRDLVRERIDRRPQKTLSVLFQSFGYKQGVPPDADMVFDSRCLPNPHWVPRLRPLTGLDAAVIEFLESQPLVEEMFQELKAFLELWVPRFEAENRTYLTIAIGCTGGQHRSVYLVERLARHFRTHREAVLVRHRELPEIPAAATQEDR